VWDSRDVEKILTQYTDDCVWEDLALGRVLSGKDEIRSFLNEWFTAFPDTTIEGKFFFASGSHGCSEWVMSGTHSGTFLDLPATGKSFSLRVASVIELSEGKVKRVTDYYDMTILLKQLKISE